MPTSEETKAMGERLRLQGEARLEVLAAMQDLREKLDAAPDEKAPGFHTAIYLNNAAHILKVRVNDFGRLLR